MAPKKETLRPLFVVHCLTLLEQLMGYGKRLRRRKVRRISSEGQGLKHEPGEVQRPHFTVDANTLKGICMEREVGRK
jgi:hypothetical protein